MFVMKRPVIFIILTICICISNIYSQNTLPDYLIINGKDIWVRDLPTTGKVVMKLNEGNKCKVLEKGKSETIRGISDFWYKIEFEGKQGWVFGSQTSLKQASVSDPFLVLFKGELSPELPDEFVKSHLEGKKGFCPVSYKILNNKSFWAIFYSLKTNNQKEILAVSYYKDGKNIITRISTLFSAPVVDCRTVSAGFSDDGILLSITACDNQSIDRKLFVEERFTEEEPVEFVETLYMEALPKATTADELYNKVQPLVMLYERGGIDNSLSGFSGNMAYKNDKYALFYFYIQHCGGGCFAHNYCLLAIKKDGFWTLPGYYLDKQEFVSKRFIPGFLVEIADQISNEYSVMLMEAKNEEPANVVRKHYAAYLIDNKILEIKKLQALSASAVEVSGFSCNEEETINPQKIRFIKEKDQLSAIKSTEKVTFDGECNETGRKEIKAETFIWDRVNKDFIKK
jgi:hypothetical protein